MAIHNPFVRIRCLILNVVHAIFKKGNAVLAAVQVCMYAYTIEAIPYLSARGAHQEEKKKKKKYHTNNQTSVAAGATAHKFTKNVLQDGLALE